jgi:hypothetical protein
MGIRVFKETYTKFLELTEIRKIRRKRQESLRMRLPNAHHPSEQLL